LDGWASHGFHIDRWWNEAVENQAGNRQLGGGPGMTEWTGVGTLFGVSPFDCDAGSHRYVNGDGLLAQRLRVSGRRGANE